MSSAGRRARRARALVRCERRRRSRTHFVYCRHVGFDWQEGHSGAKPREAWLLPSRMRVPRLPARVGRACRPGATALRGGHWDRLQAGPQVVKLRKGQLFHAHVHAIPAPVPAYLINACTRLRAGPHKREVRSGVRVVAAGRPPSQRACSVRLATRACGRGGPLPCAAYSLSMRC